MFEPARKSPRHILILARICANSSVGVGGEQVLSRPPCLQAQVSQSVTKATWQVQLARRVIRPDCGFMYHSKQLSTDIKIQQETSPIHKTMYIFPPLKFKHKVKIDEIWDKVTPSLNVWDSLL